MVKQLDHAGNTPSHFGSDPCSGADLCREKTNKHCIVQIQFAGAAVTVSLEDCQYLIMGLCSTDDICVHMMCRCMHTYTHACVDLM